MWENIHLSLCFMLYYITNPCCSCFRVCWFVMCLSYHFCLVSVYRFTHCKLYLSCIILRSIPIYISLCDYVFLFSSPCPSHPFPSLPFILLISFIFIFTSPRLTLVSLASISLPSLISLPFITSHPISSYLQTSQW